MLNRLDKFAPLLAVGVLAWLGWSVIGRPMPARAHAKAPPQITKQMLQPKLVAPTTRASPIDRDPFEVKWASYYVTEAGANIVVTTGPAPTSQPVVPDLPSVPGQLEGVILGEAVRLAVIGDGLYKVDALVGGTDPATCWRIETIEQDSVTLRLGQYRQTLKLVPQAQARGRAGRR